MLSLVVGIVQGSRGSILQQQVLMLWLGAAGDRPRNCVSKIAILSIVDLLCPGIYFIGQQGGTRNKITSHPPPPQQYFIIRMCNIIMLLLLLLLQLLGMVVNKEQQLN